MTAVSSALTRSGLAMKSDTLAQLLARPTVTDDVIAKYIAQQDVETDDTDFKVTE